LTGLIGTNARAVPNTPARLTLNFYCSSWKTLFIRGFGERKILLRLEKKKASQPVEADQPNMLRFFIL